MRHEPSVIVGQRADGVVLWSLKKESIHGEDYATRDQAKANIFEYTEAFYNRARKHSSRRYVTPDEYERGHNQTHR